MMWMSAVRTSANYGRRCSNALRASANVLERATCDTNAQPSFHQQHGNGQNNARKVCYKPTYLHQAGFLRDFCLSFSSGPNNETEVQSQDKEDDFCELDSPLSDQPQAEAADECHAGDSSYLSEAEDEQDEEEEEDQPKNKTPLIEAALQCILSEMPAKLEDWLQHGNVLTRAEVHKAIKQLRRLFMYRRALKVYEWLWVKKPFTFDDKIYASRLDLIAKVKGIFVAEKYLETIPSEMKGVKVYRALLGNCSFLKHMKKTEEAFQKIKDAGYPLCAFDYNSLFLLYKQVNKKKICDVLEMMEQDNVKPNSHTYRILIDAKGLEGDIVGMEQIVENMKAEGIESDCNTLAVLAKHYIFAGNTKKAEALVEEIESIFIEKNERYILRILLPLYANLGKVIEVERIWTKIESFPELSFPEYIAGIKAWGKLGKIDKAELTFERWVTSGKKLVSSVPYNTLLHVYAWHNLLLKGKELVKRMSDNGMAIDPITWDAIVRLYLNSGDVEKADAVLFKASEKKRIKPLYGTLIAILRKYAEKGDIANAEKIFDRSQSAGYTGRIKSYECLLQAYVNAQVPAYGFKERMVGDKLFPSRRLSNILQKVDTLKKDALKTDPISEILD